MQGMVYNAPAMTAYDKNKSSICNNINKSQLLTVQGYCISKLKNPESIGEAYAMKFALERVNTLLQTYPEN